MMRVKHMEAKSVEIEKNNCIVVVLAMATTTKKFTTIMIIMRQRTVQSYSVVQVPTRTQIKREKN